MKSLCLPVTLLFALSCQPLFAQAVRQPSVTIASPDDKLALTFALTEGSPTYSITRNGQPALAASHLGLIRDDADFTKNLHVLAISDAETIEDTYQLLTAKRRNISYKANRRIVHVATADNQPLDITFQVSNDGIAFRYTFPDTFPTPHKITKEDTTFRTLPNTTAWLQPMSPAKSGWMNTHPSYEEYYQKEIPAGTPSTLGAGWVYPALFHAGDNWLVISEAGLGRNYCGTRLAHESPSGEYAVAFPDPRETLVQIGEGVNPESMLPWSTPWRIIAVGSLKTIAESTLGTDVADKPSIKTLSAIAADVPLQTGKSSWSWPLLGDSQTNYDTQKKFIDYAADMGWRYCLIDALWDKQIGYDKIKELADYAKNKNVSLLLWYNSNGTANYAPQTPKDRMLTHDSRTAEFEKLKAMGIKGIKVDFFGGDGQSVISYYHDLLEDSAPYGLLMNFHGATLPRGWERTYPHLMTMESIKGFEFITFEQVNADNEPTHAATIPFTRNLFDPMDFTPVSLDRINNKVQRRTTSSFELALSVLFISGIQHYPETPEGMAKMPAYVKDFMKQVPATWDDSIFLDGYPGKFVVLARKGTPANTANAVPKWYLTAINANPTDLTLTLTLDLSPLNVTRGTLITDPATTDRFQQKPVTIGADKKLPLTLKSNGGAVITFD